MAHNPHAPQGPDAHQDPAGSTQMFRAFVDEGAPSSPRAGARSATPAQTSSGPRPGVIIGVIVAVVVIVGAVWLALS